MNTRVKFCGMKRREDLAIAAELGVDAVGFVLVPKSPRFVNAAAATDLRRALPPFVSVVALFQNADAKSVQTTVDALRPDLLQFHGDEDAAFCGSFGVRYWKAVSMRSPQALPEIADRFAGADALLLDSHAPGEPGGTGRRFDWAALARIDKPIVLAGGLNPANVAQAIREVRPYAVDVSSGIERAPGVKDSAKMRDFVAAVRSANRA